MSKKNKILLLTETKANLEEMGVTGIVQNLLEDS